MTPAALISDPSLRAALWALTLRPGAPTRLIRAAPGGAQLALDGGGSLLVLPFPDDLGELSTRLQDAPRERGLHILVLGGAAAQIVPVLEAAAGSSPDAARLYHRSDDGALWPASGGPSALRAVRGPLAAPDDLAFEDALEMAGRTADLDAAALGDFQARLRANRPLATQALMGIMGGIFVLELLWGGTDFIPTLVRCGGLTRDALARGELWRLASSVLLHGGFGHVGFALLVLWSLGGFLERVLGSGRFLLLFFASGIAGGLLSLAVADAGVLVGSSGGLWGMLTGIAVLAWWPRGLLPAVVLPQARQVAVKNLGLNVLVSFLPGVGWAAHLGGGLLGAVLVGTGLLAWGLPAVGSRAAPRGGLGFGAAAGVLGLGYAAAMATAFAVGTPWVLASAPERAPVALGDSGLSIDLPTALSDPAEDVEGDGLVMGDLLRDPMIVEVQVASWGSSPPSADEVQEILASFAAAPPDAGLTALGAATPTRGAPTGSRRAFKLSNDLPLDTAVYIGPRGLVRVTVVSWPTPPGAWKSAPVDTLDRVSLSSFAPPGGAP